MKKEKIKRIDYICQSMENKIASNNKTTLRKINRTFEALIDECLEKSTEAEEKAITSLNSLNVNNNDSGQISEVLYKFVEFNRDAKAYLEMKDYLEDAKSRLDEEIEIEVENECRK